MRTGFCTHFCLFISSSIVLVGKTGIFFTPYVNETWPQPNDIVCCYYFCFVFLVYDFASTGGIHLSHAFYYHLPFFFCFFFLSFLVPFRDLPKYNPKRRSYISTALVDPRLNSSMSTLSGGGLRSQGPPSPCPSNRSLPPFSSASSSLSECSAYTRSESCSDSSCSGASSQFGSEDNSAITGYLYTFIIYFTDRNKN